MLKKVLYILLTIFLLKVSDIQKHDKKIWTLPTQTLDLLCIRTLKGIFRVSTDNYLKTQTHTHSVYFGGSKTKNIGKHRFNLSNTLHFIDLVVEKLNSEE